MKHLHFLLLSGLLFSSLGGLLPGQTVPRIQRERLRPYEAELQVRCRVEHFGEGEELVLRTQSRQSRLVYRLFDNLKGKKLLGEGNVLLNSVQPDSTWRIPLASPAERFVVEIVLTDLEQNQKYTNVLEVDRGAYDVGWYALAGFNGRSVLPAYAPVGVSVRPYCRRAGEQTLWVRFFSGPTATAPPPDALRDEAWSPRERPDSTWRMSNGGQLRLLNEGLYLVSADSAAREGFPVLATGGDFPDLTRADDLAGSIRYITTNDEYARLTERADIKPELDRFWLGAADGDKEKARALIRLYYSRIRAANGFFTDCKEGWKTDRGIIYTIFGPPQQVEKRDGREDWFYGPTILRGEVVFVFESYFSGQWLLRRDYSLRTPWAAQVYEWRHGVIPLGKGK